MKNAIILCFFGVKIIIDVFDFQIFFHIFLFVNMKRAVKSSQCVVCVSVSFNIDWDFSVVWISTLDHIIIHFFIFFLFRCWLERAYISQFHLIVVASEMCEKWNKKFQKLSVESDFCYWEKWEKTRRVFMFLYINNVSCRGEEAITIGNKIKTAIPNRTLT